MDAPLTLDTFLSRGYRAKAMMQGDASALTAEFRAILTNDYSMRQAAAVKLQELNGIPDGRCIISKTQRALLAAALAAPFLERA